MSNQNLEKMEKVEDDEGITNEWMRHEVKDKISAALSLITLSMDTNVFENFMKSVDSKIAEYEYENKNVESKIKETKDKLSSSRPYIEDVRKFRLDTEARIKGMTELYKNKIHPKLENHLKSQMVAHTKITRLNGVIEAQEKHHQAQMNEKSRELDMYETQIEDLTQKSTDIHKDFDDIANEMQEEESMIEDLKSALAEAFDVTKNINSTIAATAQLTSEIEVQREALENKRKAEATIKNEINSLNARVEQLKSNQETAALERATLNKLLDELVHLKEFVSSKTEAKEMEVDPIFQREVMGCSYFLDHKEKLELEIHGNNEINEDLKRSCEEAEMEMQRIEQAQHEVNEMNTELQKLNADFIETEIDIDRLKAEFAKQTAELDELDRQNKAAERQNTALKIKEKITARALSAENKSNKKRQNEALIQDRAIRAKKQDEKLKRKALREAAPIQNATFNVETNDSSFQSLSDEGSKGKKMKRREASPKPIVNVTQYSSLDGSSAKRMRMSLDLDNNKQVVQTLINLPPVSKENASVSRKVSGTKETVQAPPGVKANKISKGANEKASVSDDDIINISLNADGEDQASSQERPESQLKAEVKEIVYDSNDELDITFNISDDSD